MKFYIGDYIEIFPNSKSKKDNGVIVNTTHDHYHNLVSYEVAVENDINHKFVYEKDIKLIHEDLSPTNFKFQVGDRVQIMKLETVFSYFINLFENRIGYVIEINKHAKDYVYDVSLNGTGKMFFKESELRLFKKRENTQINDSNSSSNKSIDPKVEDFACLKVGDSVRILNASFPVKVVELDGMNVWVSHSNEKSFKVPFVSLIPWK
jgi:hypothetical protein